MISAEKMLRGLYEVERGLEELYLGYAQRFGFDVDAGELFSRLAAEEREHAELIKFQQGLSQTGQYVDDLDEVSWIGIQQLLLAIRQALAQEPVPSLQECVATALMFETSNTEMFMGSVLMEINPGLETLVHQLTDGNADHHRRLRDFALSRGLLLYLETDDDDDGAAIPLDKKSIEEISYHLGDEA